MKTYVGRYVLQAGHGKLALVARSGAQITITLRPEVAGKIKAALYPSKRVKCRQCKRPFDREPTGGPPRAYCNELCRGGFYRAKKKREG